MKLQSSIYEKLNILKVMSISDNMSLFINRNYFSAQDSMLEYFFQCPGLLAWSWNVFPAYLPQLLAGMFCDLVDERDST